MGTKAKDNNNGHNDRNTVIIISMCIGLFFLLLVILGLIGYYKFLDKHLIDCNRRNKELIEYIINHKSKNIEDEKVFRLE